MSTTDVLTMDSKAIDMLLSNHELFTWKEVRLAAKRKVELDKATNAKVKSSMRGDFGGLSLAQNELFRNYAYNRQCNGQAGHIDSLCYKNR